MQFNDFSLQTIPHQEQPNWVMSRKWDVINFVANEASAVSWTTEGIYEWATTQTQIRDLYVTGKADAYSLQPYQRISIGYRGDYLVKPNGVLSLYLSGVDHKLHLLGAQGGLWNINDKDYIKYDNLGGDYINKWAYISANNDVEALYSTSDYLIYTNTKGLRLLKAQVAPAIFLADAPTDHDSWQKLGDQLKNYRDSDGGSKSLSSLFNQVKATSISLDGVQTSYVSLINGGFHIELDIPKGWSAPDVAGSEWLKMLKPGRWVVEYNANQGFTVTPQQEGGQLAVRHEMDDALLNVEVTATLRLNVYNHGNSMRIADVAAIFEQDGTTSIVVTDSGTLVAPRSEASLAFVLRPSKVGAATVKFVSNGHIIYTKSLQVSGVPDVSTVSIMSWMGMSGSVISLLLAILIAGVGVVVITSVYWGKFPSETNYERHQ